MASKRKYGNNENPFTREPFLTKQQRQAEETSKAYENIIKFFCNLCIIPSFNTARVRCYQGGEPITDVATIKRAILLPWGGDLRGLMQIGGAHV